jgi:hypothetical protein
LASNVPNDPEAFIDAELERLQVGLRQLKVQYDMFFAGSLPRPPVELRSELDKIVKRLSVPPSASTRSASTWLPW